MAKTFIMKHLLKSSLFATVVLFLSYSSFALVLPSANPEPVKKESTASPLSKLSVEDFLALTPKKMKELTGQKITLSQRVALKMAQSKLKKDIQNKQQANMSGAAELVDSSDFNLGGFVLGLLLSIFGVLIAYLIGDRDVIKWAWIGFGISAIIYLLILIL